jgi:hypothetical protein
MPDNIAQFPLSIATHEELSDAFGYSFGEFEAWTGQAMSVSRFATLASDAGVEEVLRSEIGDTIQFALYKGFIKGSFDADGLDKVVAQATQQQMKLAEHGSKTAGIVMLHNACERLLWRLVRFGLVHNRPKACELISDRRCKISELISAGSDSIIDSRLEEWWEQLEKESMQRKWDTLAGLVGFPNEVNSHPSWHFDRQMLENFDQVRVNAVHHDGRSVAEFDFVPFSRQLNRAMSVWATQIGLQMGLRPDAEKFFGLKRFDHLKVGQL